MRSAAARTRRGTRRSHRRRRADDRACGDRECGAAGPHLAGRLPHAQCGQRRALCRQGQERPQAPDLLCAVNAPLPARILRMIAATAKVEIVSTTTETEALLLEANLIKQLRPRFNVQLRDDKSFPYILITGDHWAPQILKHRGAQIAARALFRSVRLGRRGQPHHHGAAARVPDPLLHRRLLRKPHPALPALPDPPLRRPLHPRDRFPRLYRAGARGDRIPVRPQPCGEAGARGRNGEGVGRARIRDRGALPRPPRRAVGDPVAAGHQSAHRGRGRRVRHPSGGRLFLRRGVLLPHRAELGQPRLFPARGEVVHAGGSAGLVPGAILRRQAAAEADPALA